MGVFQVFAFQNEQQCKDSCGRAVRPSSGRFWVFNPGYKRSGRSRDPAVGVNSATVRISEILKSPEKRSFAMRGAADGPGALRQPPWSSPEVPEETGTRSG